MGVGIAQRALQGAGDARHVAGFAFAGDVLQRPRIDLAVAVAVVIRAHVLGEVVHALEALLPRVFAHPVVHAGDRRQELVAQVDPGPGGGVGAGALHVVGVVARVVQVGDDLDLGAAVRVGVDVIHRPPHVQLAIGLGGRHHVVVAGAGLALERGTGLQAVVAAHLEGDHAGGGRLHVGTLGHDLVVVHIRGHRARLGAAHAFNVGVPGGGQVFRIHRRCRVLGGAEGGAVVAGIDRVAIGDHPVLGGGAGAVDGPRHVLVQGVGHGRRADQRQCQAREQRTSGLADTYRHDLPPKAVL